MAFTILTNIPALQAVSRLAAHTLVINRASEHLSTGDRLTRASDGPAELSISEKLRLDVRTLNVAVRNANDAVSLIATTDGALEQVGNILIRLAELATQSANGTYSNSPDRTHLQDEFRSLQSEITRIAKVAKFNDILLLSNTSNSPYPIRFQVGIDGSSDSQIAYNGVNASLEGLNLADGNEVQGYSVSTQPAAITALAAVKAAIQTLAITRGAVGATESRLSVSINNLQIQRDAFADADSKIRSTDVAQTAAELIKAQMARDATVFVLGQANQVPKIVLDLLK